MTQRATRQIYSSPCQKVVILDDNLVAGFAGDAPETALRLVGVTRLGCRRGSAMGFDYHPSPEIARRALATLQEPPLDHANAAWECALKMSGRA